MGNTASSTLDENYELDISGQNLQSLPTDTDRLKHIVRLYARNNELSDLPDHFAQMNHLVEISLRHNRLSKFPIVLFHMVHITRLSLAHNRITEVPVDIGCLVNLQLLSLAGNQIRHLPLSIGKLSKLAGLDVQSNMLTSLPESVGLLKVLDTLLLQDNRLATLPESIGQCQILKVLNFKKNRVKYIPLGVGKLLNLEELVCSKNQITILPLTLLANLTNLLNLDVHSNYLSHLPDDICGAVRLRKINAAINNLRAIPDSIGRLVNLDWLNLNDNRLSHIPSSIGGCMNLKKLGMVKNQLRSLPNEIGLLKNLIKLDVRDNQLTAFPPTLKFMPMLASLVVTGNSLSEKRGIQMKKGRGVLSLKELTARCVWNRLLSEQVCDRVDVNRSPSTDEEAESIVDALDKDADDEEQLPEEIEGLGIPDLVARYLARPSLCHLCLQVICDESIEYIDEVSLRNLNQADRFPVRYTFCSHSCVKMFESKGFWTPPGLPDVIEDKKPKRRTFGFVNGKLSFGPRLTYEFPDDRRGAVLSQIVRYSESPNFHRNQRVGQAWYKFVASAFWERHLDLDTGAPIPSNWLLEQMRQSVATGSEEEISLDSF